MTKTAVQTNTDFWKLVKPFLTNKGFFENVEIMLTEKDKIVTEEKKLVKIFNDHYINIVEHSCGTKPTNVAKEQEIEDNKKTVEVICKSFANHESIKAIKENNITKNLTAGNSHPPQVSACDAEQLLRNIGSKKSTGIDMIPPKLIKLSVKVLSKPLAVEINNSFKKGIFLDNAKIACISPLDKHTDDKYSVTNFRSVSVLNTFSKIYEKIVKDFLISKMEQNFLPFLSAYPKSFSTEHVLIRLSEDWRNKLDNNNVVVAVLTDLSKAFDCIPHDLSMAKLNAYGFNRDTVAYIYSYLKNRKQCVRINGTRSYLGDIISGVPQGSILGPILYNLFLMTSFISFYKQLGIILQMTTLFVALVKQFKN